MPSEFGSLSRNSKTRTWTLCSILVLIATQSKCHDTAGSSDIQTRHFFISRIRIPVHHGRAHSSNCDSSVIAGDRKCKPSNSNGQFGNNADTGKAGGDYATNDGSDSANGGINSNGGASGAQGEGGRFDGRHGGRHGGRGGRGGRRGDSDQEGDRDGEDRSDGQHGGGGYEVGGYGSRHEGRGGRNGGRGGSERGEDDEEEGGGRYGVGRGGRRGQGSRGGRGYGNKKVNTDGEQNQDTGRETNSGNNGIGRGQGGVGTSFGGESQGGAIGYGGVAGQGGRVGDGRFGGENVGGSQLGGNLGSQFGGGNMGGQLGGNSGAGQLGGNNGGAQFGEGSLGRGDVKGSQFGGKNGGQLGGGAIGSGQLEGNAGGGPMGGGNVGGRPLGGNLGGGQSGGYSEGGQLGGGNIGSGQLGGNTGGRPLGGSNIGGGYLGGGNGGGRPLGGNIGDGYLGGGHIGGGQLGGNVGGRPLGGGNIGGGYLGGGHIGGGQLGGNVGGRPLGGGNIGGGYLGGGHIGGGQSAGGNIGSRPVGVGNIGSSDIGGNSGGDQQERNIESQPMGGNIAGSTISGGNFGGGLAGAGNIGGQLGEGNPLGGGIIASGQSSGYTGEAQSGRGARVGEQQGSEKRGSENVGGISTVGGQVHQEQRRGVESEETGKLGESLSSGHEISGQGGRVWGHSNENVEYGQSIDSGTKGNVPGVSSQWGGERGTYGSTGDVRYSAKSEHGGRNPPGDISVSGGIYGSNYQSGLRNNNGDKFQGINDQSSHGTHLSNTPFPNVARGSYNGPLATYQSDQVRCRYVINREDIYRVRNGQRKNISIDEYQIADERIAGVSYVQSDGSFGPCFRVGSYNSEDGQIPEGTYQYKTDGFYVANRYPGNTGFQGNTQPRIPDSLSQNQFAYQTQVSISSQSLPGYQVQESNFNTFDHPPGDSFTSNGPQLSYQAQQGGIKLLEKTPTVSGSSVMPLGGTPTQPFQGFRGSPPPSRSPSSNLGSQSETFNVPQVSSSGNPPSGATPALLPSNRPMGTNYQSQSGNTLSHGSLGRNTVPGELEFNRPHSEFDVTFPENRPDSSQSSNTVNEAHNQAGMTGQSVEGSYGATLTGHLSGNHQSGSTQTGISYSQPPGNTFNNAQSTASHITFGANRPTGSGFQNQYTDKEGGALAAGQVSGNNNEHGISANNLGSNSGATSINSQVRPNKTPQRPHVGARPFSNGLYTPHGPQGSYSENSDVHLYSGGINYSGSNYGTGSTYYNHFSQNGYHRGEGKEEYRPCGPSSIGGTPQSLQGGDRPQNVAASNLNDNANLPDGQNGQHTGIYQKPQGGIPVLNSNCGGGTAYTQAATGGINSGRPIDSSGSQPTIAGGSPTGNVNAGAKTDHTAGGPFTAIPGNIPTIGITVLSNSVSPGASQAPGGIAANSGNIPISFNPTVPNSSSYSTAAVSLPSGMSNLSGLSAVGLSGGGNLPVQGTESSMSGGYYSSEKLPSITDSDVANIRKPPDSRPANYYISSPSPSNSYSEQDITGKHPGGSSASGVTLPGGQSGSIWTTSGPVGEGRPHGPTQGNGFSASFGGGDTESVSLPGGLSNPISGAHIFSSTLPTGQIGSLPVGNSAVGASLPDTAGSFAGGGATTMPLPGGITAGSSAGANAGGSGQLPCGLPVGSHTGGSGCGVGLLPGSTSAGSLQGSSGGGSGLPLPGAPGGSVGTGGLPIPGGFSGWLSTGGSPGSGPLPGLSSSVVGGSLPGSLPGSMSGNVGGSGSLPGLSSSLSGGSGTSSGLSLPGNNGGSGGGLSSALPSGGTLPGGFSGSLPGVGGSLPSLSLPGSTGVSSGGLSSGLSGSGSLPGMSLSGNSGGSGEGLPSGLPVGESSPGSLPGGSLPGLPTLPVDNESGSGQPPGGLPNLPGGQPNLPGGLPNLPVGIPNLSVGLPNIPGGLPNLPGGSGGLSEGPSGGGFSNSVPDSSVPGGDLTGAVGNTEGTSSGNGSGGNPGLPHLPSIISGGLFGNSESNSGNIKPGINITFSNHATQDEAGLFGSAASRPGGAIVLTVPGGQTYVHRFPMRSALPDKLTPSLSHVLEGPETEIVRLKRVDAEVSEINYKISRFDRRNFMLKKGTRKMKDRVKRHGFKLRRFFLHSEHLEKNKIANEIPQIEGIPLGTMEKPPLYPVNSQVSVVRKLRTRRHLIVPRSSVIQKIGSNPVESTTVSTTTTTTVQEETTEEGGSDDCVVPVSQVCDMFDDIKDKMEGAKDLAETVGNVVFGAVGGGGSRGSGRITAILKGAAHITRNPFASNRKR